MELMEGLTLLSTGTNVNDSIFLRVTLISLCSLMFIIGFIMFVFSFKAFRDREIGIGTFLILWTFSCIGVAIFGFYTAFKPVKTTYKVTIDESVSMIEFNKRYEILDQDGLIYTILPKEEEN